MNTVVFIIVTIVLVLLFDRVPSHQIDLFTFLSLLLVICIGACYPLKYGQVKRINVFWLTIPILYLYGLPMMLLYYQLAVIAFLLGRTKTGNFSQYPIYSLVFLVGPLLSYSLIKGIGFDFETMSFYKCCL